MSRPEIRRVGVVGLGAMGAGIAQLAIEAGFETVGREVDDEVGAKARERIAHFLQRKVDKETMSAGERESALASLSLTTELDAMYGEGKYCPQGEDKRKSVFKFSKDDNGCKNLDQLSDVIEDAPGAYVNTAS